MGLALPRDPCRSRALGSVHAWKTSSVCGRTCTGLGKGDFPPSAGERSEYLHGRPRRQSGKERSLFAAVATRRVRGSSSSSPFICKHCVLTAQLNFRPASKSQLEANRSHFRKLEVQRSQQKVKGGEETEAKLSRKWPKVSAGESRKPEKLDTPVSGRHSARRKAAAEQLGHYLPLP